MYQNKSVSLVLPCYNEEAGVKKIMETRPAFIDEVIVVDNSSTDQTALVAERTGARVIFESRQGYGSAYLAGLAAVQSDIIVAMDGDCSYPTAAIKPCLEYLCAKNLDFVSGCRFPLKRKRSMSCVNKYGNYFLTLIFGLVAGKFIRDSQSGMWVFRREILSKMRLRSLNMAFSEEIKMEAILNPMIRFAEFHIDYHDRIGHTKLNKWVHGTENLVYLFLKKREINKRFKNNKTRQANENKL